MGVAPFILNELLAAPRPRSDPVIMKSKYVPELLLGSKLETNLTKFQGSSQQLLYNSQD